MLNLHNNLNNIFINLTVKLNKLNIFYNISASLISSILVLFILNLILDVNILLIANKSVLFTSIITWINILNTYLLIIIAVLKLVISS